jgi:manganese-transporting P-type ATPase
MCLVWGVLFYIFGTRCFDKEDLMASVCFILSLAVNGVFVLANFWSVAWNEFCAYSVLADDKIDQATHVRVKVDNRKQNTIKRFIVPLQVKSVIIASGKVNKANQIEIQKKKFIYSKDKKTFTQIPYPVDETIEYYQTAEGIENDLAKNKADLVWGPNKMSVPIPDFMDIYKEHMVAPFFVFQLFTTALWLMDEYWYYSLMTLFMLFTFEGTVVF